jgi:NADPH:quinone reductase-like Zn-dependent oxidoreductase
MKAVVCTKFGPLEVLQFQEIEKPIPRDNEVQIKVYATTVAIVDTRIRSFTVPLSFWIPARIMLGFRKPKKSVLGVELSGIITAIGKKATLFRTGDKVFAFPGHSFFGAYAEYICLPEGRVAKKPTNATFEEAAAIPFGGLAALHFLRKGEISAGKNILIYGASGCVGTFAVQLAKYFGAKIVGVCSTANMELVKSLGAETVIDYTKEDFSKKGDTYDIIFDAVGKSSFRSCMSSLKRGGVYLQAVASPALSIKMLFASIINGKKLIGGTYIPKSDDLNFLGNLVATGNIKPVIDKRYLFDQIVDAHRYVGQGHKKGNVVIAVKNDSQAEI